MALASIVMATAWDALPRRQHLEAHVQPKDREVFAACLLPLSLEEVAERIGPGFTRRMVEDALTSRILPAFFAPANGGPVTQLRRLALVRIAYGVDPCVCEEGRIAALHNRVSPQLRRVR